jgi:Protein of unknown function (DUF3306)
MTEENFFARWSRRKRETSLKTSPSAAGETAPPAQLAAAEEAQPPAAAESLPPIEAIDGETDIRGFLGDGVPAALSRAALRRAWASDPVIREFVGLSENAWDFTAPEGIPGFGTISADEIRRLLAPADDTSAAQPSDKAAPPLAAGPAPSQAAADRAAEGDASAESGEAPDGKAASPPVRRHGGALPE